MAWLTPVRICLKHPERPECQEFVNLSLYYGALISSSFVLKTLEGVSDMQKPWKQQCLLLAILRTTEHPRLSVYVPTSLSQSVFALPYTISMKSCVRNYTA